MTRLFSFLFLALAPAILLPVLGSAHAASVDLRNLAVQQDTVLLRVGDRLDRSSLLLGARLSPAPTLTETSNTIAAHVTTQYVKAAGSPDKLLTKQEALASGWGWAADHFADIDIHKKESVSLDDVLGYISQTSHLTMPRTPRM